MDGARKAQLYCMSQSELNKKIVDCLIALMKGQKIHKELYNDLVDTQELMAEFEKHNDKET